MEGKTNLIAVYGSLRKEMHNRYVLEGSELVGMFNSEPAYTMYSVGDSYPAIVEKGSTSIVMEVYSVSDKTEEKLDRLEGYDKKQPLEENYYNKVSIETPYGKASLYVFNYEVKDFDKVDSGDWVEYKKEKRNKIFEEWER